MTYSPQINETNSLSDELTVLQLKERLKKLNRLIRSENAARADYANRDRVAYQRSSLSFLVIRVLIRFNKHTDRYAW